MSDQTTQQQATQQQPAPTPEEVTAIQAARRSKASRVRQWLEGIDPWILVFIGAITLLMWCVDIITQIRTSEAMVMGAGKIAVDVQWGVLMQPWLMLTSQSGEHTTAWAYGWGIETITLIWAFALEHATQKMLETNKLVGKWYAIGSVFLIGLNGYSDFNNTPGDGLVQFLVAAVMAALVVTGLPIALSLLRIGLSRMGGQHGQ